MVRILILSLFLFSQIAGAANVPNLTGVIATQGAPVAGNGPGFTLSLADLDSTKYIHLAALNDATVNHFACFYQFGGNGACYRVPTGKTLYILDMKLWTGNTANSNSLCYDFGAATGTVTDKSATAPTGTVVYYGGQGTPIVNGLCAQTSFTYTSVPITGAYIPADYAPFIKESASQGNSSVIIIGYLK